MHYKLVLSLVFIGLSWLSFAQNKYVLEAETFFISEKYCEGADKCSLAYTKLTRKGNQAKKIKADMAFKTAECYRFTDRVREANEWYERALLLEYPFPEAYSSIDWLSMTTEDDKLMQVLVQNQIKIACTQKPTLKYYLGGYSNTFRFD